MQDAPTREELMESIGGLLLELRDALPPELRYRVTVAANAFAVAGREQAVEAQHAQAEHERLSTLLGKPTDDAWDARAKLAKAIRAGRHDNDIAGAAAVLRESVRAKLAVANPDWIDVADDGRN